jgi:extradiol dioxygenase family protein
MFHHAIAVHDLAQARAFYLDRLGCRPGKASAKRFNADFFGHHLVVHLVPPEVAERQRAATAGGQVAWRHFGVILDWPDWEALAERLTAADTEFLVEPQTRHKGEPNEEALMFLLDPSGNGVEFKTFRDMGFAFHDA